MKHILLLLAIILFTSCGGVKKTQEALNSGNYETAIFEALDNLRDNKIKKGNQPYILVLEEAFKKNTQRELKEISFLTKTKNPAHLEEIYRKYNSLKTIQQQLEPLLPLTLVKENREAAFSINSYDDKIITVKKDLSAYLYANATALLENATEKEAFRKAYDDFLYLNEITPNYKEVQTKIQKARSMGIDYVQVHLLNNTQQIIPARLEEELLNFNTYGLNDLWTTYHANPVSNINYDYDMSVIFKEIIISPEQIREKQISKERQVKDGTKFAVNSNGEVLKDSLGKKIVIDKFKTIKADFYQFTQSKSVNVTGQVSFTDLRSNQQINSYPLTSSFVFEHVYATYNGDKLAIDNDLLPLLTQISVPFPSNEAMVYDAGEDMKQKLKNIISRHRFN